MSNLIGLGATHQGDGTRALAPANEPRTCDRPSLGCRRATKVPAARSCGVLSDRGALPGLLVLRPWSPRNRLAHGTRSLARSRAVGRPIACAEEGAWGCVSTASLAGRANRVGLDEAGMGVRHRFPVRRRCVSPRAITMRLCRRRTWKKVLRHVHDAPCPSGRDRFTFRLRTFASPRRATAGHGPARVLETVH